MWRDYFLIGKIHFANTRSDEALKFLVKAKDLVRVPNLIEFETYS
jgi:hypothetical protein